MFFKNLIFATFIAVAGCNPTSSDDVSINKSSTLETFDSDSKILTKKLLNTPKKLIKNANISFKTDDINQTKKLISNLVKMYNGYIASENESNYEDQLQNYITIKIPEQFFDSIIYQLSKKVQLFENKDVSITDVTENYVDIESRLKTKKELEQKYLEILQKAKSVQEILAVESELGKIREEIESVQGRMNVLTNQIELSTISIRYYKTNETKEGFGKQIVNSFKYGIKLIKNFLLFVISLWPFAILSSLILIFVRQIKRKK